MIYIVDNAMSTSAVWHPCVLRNNAFQVNIIQHHHKMYQRLYIVGVGTSDICCYNNSCIILC